MSYAEDICLKTLNLILYKPGNIIINYRPNWLKNPNTGHNLELDFYIPKYSLGIEVQGPHHYEDNNQKIRDKIKKTLCTENGILLIVLSLKQLSPAKMYSIFRKILFPNKSHYLKSFNKAWLTDNSDQALDYVNNLQNKYGRNAVAFKSPQIDHDLENKRISNIDKFKTTLMLKPVIRVEKNGIMYDALVIDVDNGSIKVQDVHSHRIFYCNLQQQIPYNSKLYI